MGRSDGVTLLEAMFAMAIVAVLATLAVPAFADLRLDAARTATVNEFFHALFLERGGQTRSGREPMQILGRTALRGRRDALDRGLDRLCKRGSG